MTVLQSLDKYYGRLAARGDADPPGYSRKSIELCVWLDPAGHLVRVGDLNDYSGKKPAPMRLAVPQEVNRTSGLASNFLWDKTAYALGVARDTQSKAIRLTPKEHAEFKRLHEARLAGNPDPGLQALLLFLRHWRPEQFSERPDISLDMLDKNVVFGLVGGTMEYLHDRPAARVLIEAPRETWKTAFCLVSGMHAPIERLHPPIQGVDGAQTSGARLVSYNADAFTSYGAEGGANAPTSEAAAFRYGTALNRLLDRGGSNRLKIGDTTVAFWADAEGVGEEAAAACEDLFGDLMQPPGDPQEAEKIRDVLVDVAKARPLSELAPALSARARFHVLGLSPNAARLSVRYWMTDEFGAFAVRLARHYQDISLAPAPWRTRPPSVQYLLRLTTALQEKAENVPPLLAGEVTRAVLEGRPYPRTLLAAVIMRLRAGDPPHTGWHAAAIKACINRSEKETLPMARDPENASPAYQLGRLLAVLEAAQKAALGRVNASIVDRYYAAASATPARVFGPLLRNVRNHVADATRRGKGKWIEPRLNEIMSKLDPTLPRTLKLEDQGRFAVGYYHERAWFGPERPEPEAAETAEQGDAE